MVSSSGNGWRGPQTSMVALESHGGSRTPVNSKIWRHFWYQFVRFLGCKVLTVMLLLDFNMTEISWIMNLDFGCWIRETGTWKKPVLPTVDGVSNPAAKMYSIRSWQIWDFHPSMSWILVTPFSKLHFGKCLNFYWIIFTKNQSTFWKSPLCKFLFPFFVWHFSWLEMGKQSSLGVKF